MGKSKSQQIIVTNHEKAKIVVIVTFIHGWKEESFLYVIVYIVASKALYYTYDPIINFSHTRVYLTNLV